MPLPMGATFSWGRGAHGPQVVLVQEVPLAKLALTFICWVDRPGRSLLAISKSLQKPGG